MGNMLDWAKDEVEIACRHLEKDPEGDYRYVQMCYYSALKAYRCLTEDNHSGMSWSITKDILTRLMDGKPLTPIEDVPENWKEVTMWAGFARKFQCKRMSSLFKTEYPDGRVEYTDLHRVVEYDRETGTSWTSGLATRVVNDMYPIKFPYTPEDKHYTVFVHELLTDRKNGDFDTVWFTEVIAPDGTKKYINRYFADKGGGFIEISAEEYSERYRMDLERRQREREERKR